MDMAPIGSALRRCREESDLELDGLASQLIEHGFTSRHFSTERELVQVLSALEGGGPCVFQCEEAIDFQFMCVACFGVQGLRIGAAFATERPSVAPQAGALLRECRLRQRLTWVQLADRLLRAGMESTLFETRDELAEVLEWMEGGALCPFTQQEYGRFAAALTEALGEECASEIGLAQSTDLLRQILPQYW
jgi:hypothetical protein